MQNTTNFQATSFAYGGWKYYNAIKKKAMEQEFSWSGLLISLSIAFFIVLACAQILSITYKSLTAARNHEVFLEQKIYYLEDIEHINIQAIKNINTNYFKINLNNIIV